MGRLRAVHGDFLATAWLGNVRTPSSLLDNSKPWLESFNSTIGGGPQWVHSLRPSSASAGMAVTGVRWNSAGDFDAFVSALLVNVVIMSLTLFSFLILRVLYPAIFCHNYKSGLVKKRIPKSIFGWAYAAMSITPEQRMQWLGLDVAMAVEFHGLCARIMFSIGVPMLVLMAPLNYLLGSHDVDRLSRIGMANISYYHPWSYYLISFAVWAVVIVAELHLSRTHRLFLDLRAEWLQRQPLPRASTILVEGIPFQYRSDARLREFFESVFGRKSVVAATVMKRTGDLPQLVQKYAAKKHEIRKTCLEWAKKGGNEADRPLAQSTCWGKPQDAINMHEESAKQIHSRILTKREDVLLKAGESLGGVNMDTGFVTFRDRRLAEIALVLRYTWDGEAWKTSLPPEPCSVDWASLTTPRPCRLGSMAMGYVITGCLFVGFIPICLHITNLAFSFNMGPLQPIWTAFAPTLGLLIFVSLLPTVLLWIFQTFFTLYSDTLAQNHLQEWYFLFMIFFVVLVTAVGNDLTEFLRRCAAHPMSIFHLLADKLPFATHFYINYLVLQWPTNLSHCVRPFNMVRFLGARQLFEEEEARLLAEPEDQGYHGLGSRSARWTINAVIGVVFSTLNPLVPLLAGVDFCICQVMFGYIMVFAETKKNDLGGAFWVKQMQHMRAGLAIYCILMVGVLFARAKDSYPGMLALPALLLVLWRVIRFDDKICTVGLPIVELALAKEARDRAESSGEEPMGLDDTGEVYVQPELIKDGEEFATNSWSLGGRLSRETHYASAIPSASETEGEDNKV